MQRLTILMGGVVLPVVPEVMKNETVFEIWYYALLKRQGKYYKGKISKYWINIE